MFLMHIPRVTFENAASGESPTGIFLCGMAGPRTGACVRV